MIADYILNLSINNEKTRLEYDNIYFGNFHIIVNCINTNLFAYFVVSKFNILEETGTIHRMNHSDTITQIQLEFNKNEPLIIYTKNNNSNNIYNVQLKIYSL